MQKDVSKSFEELRRLVVGDGAINTPPSMSKEAKYVIDEIRSILPDYSEAFLLKCVDVYGLNAKRITQHLLEGDVPKELFEEKKKRSNGSTATASAKTTTTKTNDKLFEPQSGRILRATTKEVYHRGKECAG